MSRVDWRRMLDVGNAPHGEQGAVALEVQDDGRLRLEVQDDGNVYAEVRLDYSDAGQLLDWLREALGVQLLLHGDGVAGAAVAGVQLARDTPPGDASQPLSDRSGTL